MWGINNQKIKSDIINYKGRFPSNLLHDGSDEIEKIFPYMKSGGSCKSNIKKLTTGFFKEIKNNNELIEYLKILITPKDGNVYGI